MTAEPVHHLRATRRVHNLQAARTANSDARLVKQSGNYPIAGLEKGAGTCHQLAIKTAHRYPCLQLQATPRDLACKTRGQDGFAALLSCRALSSPTTCRFIPALFGLPTSTKPLARRTLPRG